MTAFCAYCGLPHERKGRCCSDWCSRRVTGKLAWISRSRKVAHNRVLAAIHKRERNVPTFREAAMGSLDPNETALRIFGTLPSETISDPSEGRP